MVPRLTTSLTGSLKELERLVLDRRPDGVVTRLAMLAAAIEVEELVESDSAPEARAANA